MYQWYSREHPQVYHYSNQLQANNSVQAAFRTYLAVESLPDQPVRHFQIEAEYPVVYQGEIFCRMPGLDGSSYCGVCRSGKGRLNTHLEKEHGFGRAGRHDNSKGKGSRKKALKDAQGMYWSGGSTFHELTGYRFLRRPHAEYSKRRR